MRCVLQRVVKAPFEYIACHVENLGHWGCAFHINTHWCCPVVLSCKVQHIGCCYRVSPWEYPFLRIRSASDILPFCFGWQPQSGPFEICLSVVPVYANHRVVGLVEIAIIPPLWWPMSSLFDELPILRISYGKFPDPESLDSYEVRDALGKYIRVLHKISSSKHSRSSPHGENTRVDIYQDRPVSGVVPHIPFRDRDVFRRVQGFLVRPYSDIL